MKRPLTQTAVKHAKSGSKPRKEWDGGGLYLLVMPNGAKLWRYKFRIAGKEQTYSIGSYPEISLSEARARHMAARALVAHGKHPTHERKAGELQKLLDAKNSFEAVAQAWMAEKSKNWTAGYARQVQTVLERDVFPSVGSTKLDAVTTADLREIIVAVANRTVPTDGRKVRDRGAAAVATQIRQWCGAIFRYGVAHGLSGSDPSSALRDVITRPKARHHRHLAEPEIAEFLQSLHGAGGTRAVRLAVELLMLTFVRTKELRTAEWAEFDLDAKLWRVPASKMKMGREHLVPLSEPAIARLLELQAMTGHQRFLFPNQRRQGDVMTNTTVNRYLERMGYRGRLSGHGFRGTASTVLNEHGFDSAVIEKQLAHERGGQVYLAYNHAEYLDKRRVLMDKWGDFLIAKGLSATG